MQRSTAYQILRLWEHLRPGRKKQLLLVAFLMAISSLAEVISIGSVLPFLGVLTAPEKIFNYAVIKPIILALEVKTPQDLLLPVTMIFIAAVLMAGATRLLLFLTQMRLSTDIGTDFSVKVYEHTLYQPYSLHVSCNSSEIIAGVGKATSLVGTVIQPVMLMLSSILTLIAVIGALLVIQPVATAVAALGFGLIYAIVVIVTKNQIARNSRVIASHQGRVTKALQEGLGGIRDVLIDGTQSVYIKLYKEARRPMQSAVAANQVMAALPRFGVEALGISLIAGMAYLLASADGISDEVTQTIPVLGALALGAQRLLPLLQQIYSGYVTVKGYQASTEDALDLLDQPISAHAVLSFSESIDFHTALLLKDLGFRYAPDGPWVFRKLNLKIPKGGRVGLMGVTGSGKSTLADVIMGLLKPTEGALFIDNIAVSQENTRAWQSHISHVPQVVYLSDASIAENIAFGMPIDLVDMQRVKQVAEQAQIARTIESWRDGYKTLVGERGVRLSGGQRQRIGIARALYKRANVIIFDEATSALDHETEAAVMEAVETLSHDITMLVITHRLTTLRNCDQIVELAAGGINVMGGYERMMRRTA